MVLVLGLGIGLGTAILAIVHGVLWRDLQVPDADRVAKLSLSFQGSSSRKVLGHLSGFSYPELTAYAERATSMDAVAAYRDERILWRRDGDARLVNATLVTANYFRALRVPPAIGRLLSAEDAHAPVVVVSERFWREALGGRPDILGSTLALERRTCTVIGVLAAPFRGTEIMPADVWLPLESTVAARGSGSLLTEENTSWLWALGRLAPEASLQSARAEAAVAAAHMDANYPGRHTTIAVTRASAMDPGPLGRIDRAVLIGAGTGLSAIIGILLLICGSNVGGLLLARGATRQREFALRIALGAGRARIAQQLVAEIAVVTFAGAVAGVFVCWLTLRLLGQLPPLAGIAGAIALDWRLLGLAALSALVVALLFGMAPTRQALRVDCLAGLKGQAMVFGVRVPSARLRGWLVSMQVALSLVLLVAAGLVARGIERTFRLDPGYPFAGLFTIQPDVAPAPAGSPRTGDLAGSPRTGGPSSGELSERLEATPGIRSVGHMMMAPFRGIGVSMARTDTMPAPVPVHFNKVDAAYLRTLGVPLLVGRAFTPGDLDAVVVNAALARAFWGSERGAIGQTMAVPIPLEGAATRTVEVIGVVPAVQTENLGVPDPPAYYELLAPGERANAFVVVRADPGVAVPRLALEAARVLDRDAYVQVTPIEEQIAARTGVARLAAVGAAFLGLLALAVAAVGIHGIVAHAVICRTRDIGVHLALGASRARVLGLILRQTMSGVAIGALGAGVLVAAVTLSFPQPFKSALFGLSPADPVAFLAATLTLAVVTLGAAWLPARRAVGISPIEALRHD
jgi:predicted permease